jgi:ADP-heptose:LPS heptosyltransferase
MTRAEKLMGLWGSLVVGVLSPVFRLLARLRAAPAPGSLLLIRLDEIGDFVLSTPLIAAIGRANRYSRVTLCVKPETLNLAELCPYVTEVLAFRAPRTRFRRAFFAPLKATVFGLRTIAPRKFHTALLPRFDADTYGASFVAAASLAPLRLAFSEVVTPRKKVINRGYDHLFSAVRRKSIATHEADKTREWLDVLGVPLVEGPARPELWLSAADRERATRELSSFTRNGYAIVGVVPGASAVRKEWPLDRYVELISLLSARQLRVILLGGIQDIAKGDFIRSRSQSEVRDLTGILSLRETAAVFEKCAIYVGSDTGPKHLAAASGVPVVEISSIADQDGSLSDVHARFSPLNVPCRVVRPSKARTPCVGVCESREPHCIAEVLVSDVLAAVLGLLEGQESQSTAR